jgi:putative ABC transport system ATP-binding protein
MDMSLVVAEGITKDYRVGDIVIPALGGVSFAIDPASFVSFIGPSGSGKTTLLNLIGCLDAPTSGRLTVAGTDVGALDRRQGAAFRGANIGFIFQDFNLLPVLTAYENIEYPLIMVEKIPQEERRRRVTTLLETVGMADQANKRPDQLSGGQKQRVAIARALVTKPKVVLADEPTANLDSHTAHTVIELMKKIRDELRTTFIFSTHDQKLVGEVEILFTLEDGLIKDRRNGEAKP